MRYFYDCRQPNQGKNDSPTLIAEKLAACVQIGSEIKSVYVWRGKTHSEIEFTLP
ncbi:MAG: divalent cation tolerance protein CutA [Bacilli bacterium]